MKKELKELIQELIEKLIEVLKKIPKIAKILLCSIMFIALIFAIITPIEKAKDNAQEGLVHDIESLESLLE